MIKRTGKIKPDQQTVILEDINSKLALVLEQFSGIRSEIRSNHKEFLEFRDRTDKNLKVALEYLFRIDEEIQDMKTEIADLKSRPQKKEDGEKILQMEKRLIKLEKLVFAKLG